MSKEMIYFDNNATTKINDQVLKLMIETYQSPFNSSSAHQFGQIAGKHVNEAKAKISNLLNGEAYQIIFNSGATEANNIAIKSFADYKIITSSTEHPAVLSVAKLQDALIINVDENGIIKLDEFEESLKNLDSKDFLVSIMLANNETGVIQPLKEIAKITHQYGGLIHSDITQGFGKIEVDLEDLNIDLASISSHKISGPQGVGALLVRTPIEINALMQGGKQEGGKRPGTTNVAGIVGFGEACKIAQENIRNYQKTADLRNYLENKVQEIATDNIVVFGKNVARLPNTSFFATKNLDNQTLMMVLDLNNIAVSVGSACSSGVAKTSHVLKGMNVDDKIARCAVRVSFSNHNTKAQIDKFITIWQELYNKKN